MKMYITKSGSLTTVQDEGRFGYMEYGISESGAMDRVSYNEANKLIGNMNGEAALEFTLMGSDILFDADTIIAYMGAEMNARIDDVPIERGKAYKIKEGQKLMFGFAEEGIRSYLAVAGGIDVPVVLGSRSTNLKCRLGGYYGRKLVAGDELLIGEFDIEEREQLVNNMINVKEYPHNIRVRAIKGPQDDYYTEAGLNTFFNTQYTVSVDSDRMGIRLQGESIESKNGMDIVSDGITFGSVQITSSGLPIILMADHQTTGGYAKIATVVKDDLQYLAQARPGDTVSFECVSINDMKKDFWKKFFDGNKKEGVL